MIGGKVRTALVKLAGTQGTILEGGQERRVITQILLSNITGGALTATLDVTRSSVDYNICTAKSVGANDFVHIKGEYGPLISLEPGDTLKGLCNSANNVHCIVTYTTLGPAGG